MRALPEARSHAYPSWLRFVLLGVLTAMLALFIFMFAAPPVAPPPHPPLEQPIQTWTDPPPGRMF